MLILQSMPTATGEWVAIVASYLLGALPFGLILARIVGGIDIRTVGSGNIGATNVGRALGRPFAVLAFVLDFAKGWGPSFLLGPALAADPGQATRVGVLCGVAAVCGHVWPVYLGFKGGKGVATTCGAVSGIDPLVFLGGGAVWLVCLVLFRMVGLSSLAMGLAFPLLAWWRGDGIEVVWGLAALCLLIFVRHRANMKRMLSGKEPRIGRPDHDED